MSLKAKGRTLPNIRGNPCEFYKVKDVKGAVKELKETINKVPTNVPLIKKNVLEFIDEVFGK